MQRHLTEQYPELKVDVYSDIVEDMKYLVVKTFESVRNKINPDSKKGCFELLGFDFMIDVDLTVWLIECNTNPCIEESSQLLKQLLPRMLDDAFKLTLDRQFPVVSRPSAKNGLDIGGSNSSSNLSKKHHENSSGANTASTSAISRMNSVNKIGSYRKSEGRYSNPSQYYVEGYSSQANLW